MSLHTDAEINKGTQGAKRASFQKTSYRDVALKILIDNPEAEVEDVVEEFVTALLANREALTSLAIYGLANVKASIVRPVREYGSKKPTPTIRERVIEREAKRITKRIVENLLDFEMPNGKTLGQSSGAECEKAATYHGQRNKWLLAIAKKVGKRGIVGEVLSNADLKKMLKH